MQENQQTAKKDKAIDLDHILHLVDPDGFLPTRWKWEEVQKAVPSLVQHVRELEAVIKSRDTTIAELAGALIPLSEVQFLDENHSEMSEFDLEPDKAIHHYCYTRVLYVRDVLKARKVLEKYQNQEEEVR